MNDIETLARMRDDIAPATPAALFRARNLLLDGTTARRKPRLTGGRKLALTTATAFVVTGGIAAGTTIGMGSHAPPATASAADVLTKAAAYVAKRSDATPLPHQFAYTKVVRPKQTGGSGTDTVEDWRRVDGADKEETLYQWTVGGAEVQQLPCSITGFGFRSECSPLLPMYHPSYDYLAGLPTDPDALLKAVYQQVDEQERLAPDASTDRDHKAFWLISDVLTTELMPHKVAAAFFEAAAKLPGVTVDPNAHDVLGRAGTGVTIPMPEGPKALGGSNSELVFAKTSGKLLGSDEGALVGQAFVDKIGERP